MFQLYTDLECLSRLVPSVLWYQSYRLSGLFQNSSIWTDPQDRCICNLVSEVLIGLRANISILTAGIGEEGLWSAGLSLWVIFAGGSIGFCNARVLIYWIKKNQSDCGEKKGNRSKNTFTTPGVARLNFSVSHNVDPYMIWIVWGTWCWKQRNKRGKQKEEEFNQRRANLSQRIGHTCCTSIVKNKSKRMEMIREIMIEKSAKNPL